MKQTAQLWLTTMLCCLTACSAINAPMPARAPVDESGVARNSPSVTSAATPTAAPPMANPNQYQIQKGDTLSGISKKLGIPMQRLAELNQLSPPYTIQQGQILNLPPLKNAAAQTKPAVDEGAQVQTAAIKPSGVQATGVQSSPPPAPVASEAKPAGVPAAESNKTSSTPADSSNVEAVADSTLKWQWPIKGKLVASFDGQSNKGINLSGAAGEAVTAAAAGKVIYSGMDIRGTGKLLIVKHNSNYLSVYGHQGVNLLKEGSMVAAGEKLATLATSGTPLLHFEIRLKGKPIDPTSLLGS
jgi:lipoprotein NlpD